MTSGSPRPTYPTRFTSPTNRMYGFAPALVYISVVALLGALS